MDSHRARRQRVLRELVDRTGSTEALIRELQTFPWDYDEELVEIRAADVRSLLDDFLHDRVSAGEVERWADHFEVRDDIGFESGAVKEAVHRLANPYLEGGFTEQTARDFLKMLE